MLSPATTTSFTFFTALSVLLRVAAAPTCDSRASGRCTACGACCKGYLSAAATNSTAAACAACVAAECAAGRHTSLCDERAPPGALNNGTTCDQPCVEQCWFKPWSPCLRDCSICAMGRLLLLTAMLPYNGRLVVDWLVNKLLNLIMERCQVKFRCCRPAYATPDAEQAELAGDGTGWRRRRNWLATEEELAGDGAGWRRSWLATEPCKGAHETSDTTPPASPWPPRVTTEMPGQVGGKSPGRRWRASRLASLEESEELEPTVGSAEQQETGDIAPKGGYTMRMLIKEGSSWAGAVEANGQSPAGATLTAAGRLLFWHWLQPALYWAVFACFYDQIRPGVDGAQKGFGWAVAVREALYLLNTLVALYANPAFLLVDVGASVRDTAGHGLAGRSGYGFLAMYVLAPEKFVALAAYSKGGLDWECVTFLALLGGVLLDLCGVGALIAGLAAGSLPGALAVGYAATALAFLCFIGLGVASCVEAGACCCQK
eukprot:COSAG01_NODE_520_length_16006_cov_6.454077_3_plen_488_part_00